MNKDGIFLSPSVISHALLNNSIHPVTYFQRPNLPSVDFTVSLK